MLAYLWDAAKSFPSKKVRDLPPKDARNTIVKQDQILKLQRQILKQSRKKVVRNLFALDRVAGLVNAAKLRGVDGNVKMENKNLIITLATMVVVGVFASYGMVIKQWVDWTTTTLVDLDKRTAIMEVEAKHTNEMVAENQEMLKILMEKITKVNYGNGKGADGTTDINWRKAQSEN